MSDSAMVTVKEWRDFLRKWSAEWLSTDEPFPRAVRKSGWLGFTPATEAQIEHREQLLGYRLPPSFRAFLLTTNGWRRPSRFVERIRPLNRIKWLEVDDPQFLDVWAEYEDTVTAEGVPPEEYFSYKFSAIFDCRHLKHCLKIADPVGGDSAMYLLNPVVVAEDGEWEAWVHAHWIPGARRYPSFSHLMRDEHHSFHCLILGDESVPACGGPFGGVHAPDRQRHPAERIGPGQRWPRRFTVPELIQKLESRSARTRLAVAKQLFREDRPHDPADERPELVETLSRILASNLERDVRSAAACMLGSYGDHNAVKPLVAALDDPNVADAAVGALHYLSVYMKDTSIANGLCKFLASPRHQTPTSTAMHVLEDFRDPRLASIALTMLDGAVDSQLRFQAAFALAATSPTAADQLMARLTHANPETRAAGAAALRLINDRRAIEPLRAALTDSDPNVRIQSAMSLRHFGEDIAVSPADEAEAKEQLRARLLSRGNQAAVRPGTPRARKSGDTV